MQINKPLYAIELAMYTYNVLNLQLDTTQKSLTYMQENHKTYPKLCVYWIGPFIPWVFTADVETMKIFFHQPGGMTLYNANEFYTIAMQLCMSL